MNICVRTQENKDSPFIKYTLLSNLFQRICIPAFSAEYALNVLCFLYSFLQCFSHIMGVVVGDNERLCAAEAHL